MLEQVGKYEILQEIGHGGMATVYRARDTHLKREVALKVMHPHLQGAPEARARFEREAQTVARLQHPGLLDIYDYSGEGSDTSFIATELLGGPTLKRFSDDHPDIPAEIAACMVLQVAGALSAAHGAGVVHRDVKPENLMFHHGHVKLTDFGIAQLVDVQGMTTTGQVLGSPGHMAPEQIEGQDCTPQSDIFALGTVLYLLATGRLPFQGKNPHQVLKQIVEGDYPDPMRVRPSIGEPLARVIRRCLARSQADRYVSTEQLVSDLQGVVDAAGIADPDAALEAYLADPDGFSRRFRLDLIDRLIAAGEAAQRAGRRPQALEHFNRVLALDDGNPRVMEALAQMGRRSRFRVAGLAAVAMVAVAALLWWWSEAAAVQEPVAMPALEVSGVASGGGPLESVEAATTSQAPPAADAPADVPEGGQGEGGRGERQSPGPASEAEGTARAGAPQRRPRPPNPKPAVAREERQTDVPRTVRFSPTPANVSIGVDGGELKPFGPSFREISLSPGVHRFRFVGAFDCCEELEFEARIPPGPGTTVLNRRLAFRPAGLYVVSDQPANVEVDGGAVSGRTRSVLRVPHEESLRQKHLVRVTANGYAPFEVSVSLQAGQVKTLEVPLRPLTEVEKQGAANL